MKRFEQVRLGDALGQLSVGEESVPFLVVEAARTAAVVSKHEPLVGPDFEERIALHLLEAGYPLVVFIGPEARGAAVAHCYSRAEQVIEDAACAIWAVKAIAGWDESPLMTFLVTHVCSVQRGERTITVRAHDASWVTVRAMWADGVWSVDVERLRMGGWSALLADVCPNDASTTYVVVGDVDWAMAFNDAYGHQQGDLMLARVHACIESAALEHGATCVRVAGDEFAVLLHSRRDARAMAETIRAGVEALNIPFEHAEIRTHGRVTVSVGVAQPRPGTDLRIVVEDAILDAKRAGRNRVAAHLRDNPE